MSKQCELIAECNNERNEVWIPMWRACENLLSSSESKIGREAGNQKFRPNNRLFDSTGAESLDIAASGLVSQIMSPARRWMSVTVTDSRLIKQKAVKRACEQITDALLRVMADSNFYGGMAAALRDCLWATGAVFFDIEDEEDAIRLYHLKVGTFSLRKNERDVIDTCVRDFTLKLRDAVEKFGFENMPRKLQITYEQGRENPAVVINHLICPNDEYVVDGYALSGKKFMSAYYIGEDEVRRKGCDLFPVVVFNWRPDTETAYGTNCAIDAFPYLRMLQKFAKDRLKASGKAVDPALAVPASVSDVTRDPGDTVVVAGQDRVYNLEDIRYDWANINLTIQGLQTSVRRAFKADLFQHFLNSDRREQTAEEVRAKLDEQFAGVAPIIANLTENPIAQAIDIVFAALVKKKLLPEIPPELAGVRLKIRYYSVFEQAQRAGQLNQMRGHAADMAAIVQWYPQATDVADIDELLQQMAEARQLPEDISRDDVEIAQRRDARAQLQAQQMQEQQAAQEAQNLQALGKARVAPDTLLGAGR